MLLFFYTFGFMPGRNSSGRGRLFDRAEPNRLENDNCSRTNETELNLLAPLASGTEHETAENRPPAFGVPERQKSIVSESKCKNLQTE